jgi:hypothetical protein
LECQNLDLTKAALLLHQSSLAFASKQPCFCIKAALLLPQSSLAFASKMQHVLVQSRFTVS